VLVVDDNADVRAYIRRHLDPPYRVLEAANGAQGVAMAHSTLPDLIVSDVMMPDVDGLELCRMLKGDRDTAFIPIVLLTAKAAPEDRIEGLREHCDDYLTKPFDPGELRARVENLIDQRRRLLASYGRPAGAAGSREYRPSGVHADPVQPFSADAVFLERVKECIEAHIADEDFSVERLAAGVGLSRAHLHRRLRELLSQTPSELIRGMRLERAAELLGARAGSVSEVAYAVGFKSVAHFSNAFNARYGCRPSAYPGALEGEPG
jgi:DNA-binding response OmpR family regulator